MTRRFALVRMARPGNLLVVAAGVVVGAWLVPESPLMPGSSVLFAACAAALVAAAANIHNDVVDRGIDAINRPDRPLPAGHTTIRKSWVAILATVVGAVVIAATISTLHVALVVVIAGLLAGYNMVLKHLPLIGNVIVGVVVSTTIVFGALAPAPNVVEVGTHITAGVLVAVLFAFLLTVAREVVKDLQDFRGDAAHESRSLPHTAGIRNTQRIAWGIVAVAVCIVPLPYVYLGFPGLYLVVVFPAACFLLVVLVTLARDSDEAGQVHGYGRASTMLKLSMVFGLAALALSSPSL